MSLIRLTSRFIPAWSSLIRSCHSIKSPSLLSDYTSLHNSLSSSGSPHSALNQWSNYQSPLDSHQLYEIFRIISHKSRETKTSLFHSSVYGRLCHQLVEAVDDLPVGHVTDILWLLGCLRINHHQLIHKVIEKLEYNISNMSSYKLGLIMWSLGVLRYSHGVDLLFEGVASETILTLKGGMFKNSRSLANICWCYAVLDKWPSSLTQPLLSYLKRNIKTINDRYLSIVTWSLQRANVQCEKWLLEPVSHIALSATDPHVLSLTSWTLGKARYYDESFYSQLSDQLLNKPRHKWYSPRLTAEVLWCLARVRYYHPQLMEHLANMILSDINSLSAQNLSNTAYSYGFLNHTNYELLDAIVGRIVDLSHSSDVDILAIMNITWSCLVADVYPRQLIDLCFDKFEKLQRNGDATSFIQMLQLHLASVVEKPHLSLPRIGDKKSELMSKSLDIKFFTDTPFHTRVVSSLNKLFNSSNCCVTEAYSTSSYIIDIEVLLDENDKPIPPINGRIGWSKESLKELCGLSYPFHPDQLASLHNAMSGGEYNLSSDWSIHHSSDVIKRKLCIECDGPVHFAINNNHQLSRTTLKQRQLNALGWEVIQVPYFEWNKLNFNEEKHVKYLTNKIFNKT